MMRGKPVAAHRFSPAELEAARQLRLTDVIADDLVVLFCGANPGLSSAAAGAPFATPSEGGRLLRRRVLARRPRWLAVLGVTAYRAAFGRPDAAVGLQEDMIGSTRIWILPNPSGLNAHYPPRALAAEFARLRVAAGLPDRSRRPDDAPLCRDHPARAVGGPWLW